MNHKFENMKFIAAVLVVLLHAFNAMDPEAGGTVRKFMMSGPCATAVPFFFFAAGYFLAGRFGEAGWWRRALTARIRTLVIPYFVWNVACLGATAIISGGGVKWLPLDMPPYNVTWFLRSLFLFVLVSPLVYWAGQRPKAFGLMVAACVGIWAAMKPNVWLTWGFSIYGFVYFMLGAAARMRNWHLTWLGKTGSWLCIGAGMAMMAAGTIWALPQLTAGAAPVVLAGIWRFVPQNIWPEQLTAATFAIYLLHPALIYGLAGVWRITSIGETLALAVMATTGAIALFALGKRVAPGATSVIFGGRV